MRKIYCKISAKSLTLKQDFWSILGQTIYFAFGLNDRRVRKHNIKVIPVAIGTTMQATAFRKPEDMY